MSARVMDVEENTESSAVDEQERIMSEAAAAGSGNAAFRHGWARGAYENYPGQKRRMRVYCFRSPAGEMDGWIPKTRDRKPGTDEIPKTKKAAKKAARKAEREDSDDEEFEVCPKLNMATTTLQL